MRLKGVIIALCLFSIIFSFCSDHSNYIFSQNWWGEKNDNKIKKELLEKFSKRKLQRLTIQEKLGQILMISILPKDYKKIFTKIKPGSVILFNNILPKLNQKIIKKEDRNINLINVVQLKKMIQSYHKLSLQNKIIPAFFAIDQEGGFVRRIQNSITEWPSMMNFGEVDQPQKTQLAGFYHCLELKSLGIDWSLGPVAEVVVERDNPVIMTRSFGSTAKLVMTHTQAWLYGSKQAGCMNTMKHFPGHGRSKKDSHLRLPIQDISLEKLMQVDIKPYVNAIKKDLVTSVMPGHLVYSKIDKKPATISHQWLEKILRQKLQFNGLIISDDMGMGAINYNQKIEQYVDNTIKAIHAGVNVILINIPHTYKLFRIYNRLLNKVLQDPSLQKLVTQSAQKILLYKSQYGKLKKQFIKFSKKQKIPLTTTKTLSFDSNSQKKASRLNEYISRNSLRIKKGILTPWLRDPRLSSYTTITDIKEGNILLPMLSQKQKNIISLDKALNANLSKTNKIIFIHTSHIKFKKILQQFKQKYPSKQLLIYSITNPYPYSSIGKFLTPRDTYVTTFSNTSVSTFSMVQSFVLRTPLSRAKSIY